MIKFLYLYLPIINIILMLIAKEKYKKFILICLTYIMDIIFIKIFNYFFDINSFLDFNNIFISIYCCFVGFFIYLIYKYKKLQIKSKIKRIFIISLTIVILLFFCNKISLLNGILLIINYAYFIIKIIFICFFSLKNLILIKNIYVK